MGKANIFPCLICSSAQNLGTDFEFNLFGIHKSDCNNLSTALKRSNLKILQLSNNLMDTEKLNLLLTGIKYIPTLTTLGILIILFNQS